jgi:hypothetical protein
MKKMWMVGAVLTVAVVLVLVGAVNAADEKEVKLTGAIVCGKCALKETDKCSNVLIVKDGDKEVKYYLQDKGVDESFHKDKVCTTGKKGSQATVTGKVEVKDGKNLLTASKVEFK